jgi:rhamnose utilization protein RhaD (predicted bifunctional aldolase and dehydrogenase)
MSVEELAVLSRHYGSDPEYVIAGGGNTSFKDESTLWVKGSGVSLAGIQPADFVAMDRGKLSAVLRKQYPPDAEEREAAVLAGMLAARKSGEENKRPSVETLIHDLIPFPWVVHLHPAMVNGITCSVEGSRAASRLFGENMIWIPAENPGYVLSLRVKEALEALEARGAGEAAEGRSVPPGALIFLQNHGIFAAANSAAGIRSLYGMIMEKTGNAIRTRPDFSGAVDSCGSSGEAAALFAECAGGSAIFARNRAIAGFVENRSAFAPLSFPFTPDHIVYAGSDPLFVESPPPGKSLRDHITQAWKEHLDRYGSAPKIAALEGTGVFGVGLSEKASRLALELFADSIKVAVYAESFGGRRFMEADKIAFINNWEAERYRSQRI